ncbi:MAG: site-2 protease family protein [Candidatus Nealsonbacteria bacterium]|nr:site-2 protease family protein [Candidatus Nealsonbacteria bacterium]
MIITILVAFISLMGLMIIHEFGHFILAKKFGADVEEFGVGYPPRIFAKKIGAVVYSLNLIPFGAFVNIKGEKGGIEDPHSFAGKPMLQRVLIVLGGVISFWLVAILLLSIVAGVWGLPFVRGFETPSPWYQAPLGGIIGTANLTIGVVQGWIMGVKSMLGVAQLPPGVELEMMGPLGIFDLMRTYFAMGINYYLFLVSLISVALALANLLPIPALDGGKIVFLAIEAIRKKPLNHKLEARITGVFFALLIILMIFVTINFDIPRLF